MTLSVAERARSLATFRFVDVFLMETLARWVPSTPEMEVKVLFGQHIWDVAQHADALGRRTFELRAPLHHSLRPADAYFAVLEQLAELTATADRLAAVYDVGLPALERRFLAYLEATDPLMDAPSVRILERALADLPRMRREAQQTRAELPDGVAAPDAGRLSRLRESEASVAAIVAAPDLAEASR